VSQIFGDFSDSYMGLVSLVAQPFPEWRLSPYFTVGTGLIYTDPKSTLVDESDDDRTDQVGSTGAGVRLYLTRRFVLRAEYRRNTIFQDKDDNQEIDAWQAGIGFFF
jgi:opacity protein-like surface antigen